jgi:hypothetical protein
MSSIRVIASANTAGASLLVPEIATVSRKLGLASRRIAVDVEGAVRAAAEVTISVGAATKSESRRTAADNPRYSMALLLREALDAGAPPSMARLPMTPEEVAAAYDVAERAEDDTR